MLKGFFLYKIILKRLASILHGGTTEIGLLLVLLWPIRSVYGVRARSKIVYDNGKSTFDHAVTP